MGEPFTHELRVRYGECDPQGVVFNANYLAYFDVAFTELWRAGLGPWTDMLDRGIDAMVAEANMRFRAPARFDDVIAVRARVTRLGNSAITTSFDVSRGEERLVEGWLRHVCVALPQYTKTPIPDWVRDGLRPFATTEAEAPA